MSSDGGVVDVRLNRPDKLNALDLAMYEALVEASEAIKRDPSARVVVLSGVGRAFCAGLDRRLFLASAGDETATKEVSRIVDPRDRLTHLGQQASWGWREVPVPVIAAIHGNCLGGGTEIVLGADIRVVSPDARLSVREIEWGLTPDMCGTVTLPSIVPHDIAKLLAMTGRIVDGTEALRLGLATCIADNPREEALAIAAEIARRNPDAIRALKRMLDPLRPGSLAERFRDERVTIQHLGRSPNTAEAALASFEGREPQFVDPRL
ncbi:MAG: crotonase/enoyl-CoA hydratase family protein [Acidimicrobiales bacterium]